MHPHHPIGNPPVLVSLRHLALVLLAVLKPRVAVMICRVTHGSITGGIIVETRGAEIQEG